MTDNEKIRSTLSKKAKKTKDSFHTAYNKHTIYMYIVVALVLTFIVEMIAGIAAFDHSKMYGVYFLIGSPYVFICNAFIVMMTLSFTLLLRKRIFWISVISVMWIILGVTNGVLVATRVTPLTASDYGQVFFYLADYSCCNWSNSSFGSSCVTVFQGTKSRS